MKSYRTQTPQNLALTKILQKISKNRAHPWVEVYFRSIRFARFSRIVYLQKICWGVLRKFCTFRADGWTSKTSFITSTSTAFPSSNSLTFILLQRHEKYLYLLCRKIYSNSDFHFIFRVFLLVARSCADSPARRTGSSSP